MKGDNKLHVSHLQSFQSPLNEPERTPERERKVAARAAMFSLCHAYVHAAGSPAPGKGAWSADLRYTRRAADGVCY